MPYQSWTQVLKAQKTAGTLLNTFTTAKSILNTDATYTLPAQYFDNTGISLEIDWRGAISNIVTTPGTITFQVMFGSVIAWTSGAIQLNATAHTTLPATLNVKLSCRTIGSGTSAVVIGQGTVAGVMFTATAGQTDGANTQTILQVPATAPANGTGFDSTVAQTVDLWAGFSISNAGNGVQTEIYELIAST